jgi:hypothetical protein
VLCLPISTLAVLAAVELEAASGAGQQLDCATLEGSSVFDGSALSAGPSVGALFILGGWERIIHDALQEYL